MVVLVLSLVSCGGSTPAPSGGGDQPSGGGDTTPTELSTITLDMSTLFIVPSLEATQKVEDQLNDYLLNTLHESSRFI